MNSKCKLLLTFLTIPCLYVQADTSVEVEKSCTTYELYDVGPGGGYVFYIKPDSEGCHGLEAAPEDQSSEAWGCLGTDINNTSPTIGAGSANTDAILERCSTRPTAASVARSYTGGGFNDWFLPSVGEYKEMYTVLHKVSEPKGNFSTTASYWSSTQSDFSFAWNWNFLLGTQYNDNFKRGTLKVRAARAF